MKYVYLISCLVCVFVPFSDGEWMMRNEANFASAFKEREHEMHKVFDSPLIHDLIERERSYPLTAETLMTEERFAMKVLEDSDTIYSQLEGKVLARCLADIGTYLGNLSDGASYAWQSESHYILSLSRRHFIKILLHRCISKIATVNLWHCVEIIMFSVSPIPPPPCTPLIHEHVTCYMFVYDSSL